MDLEKVPILKSLINYYEEGVIPLHTPGHKKGNIYSKIGLEYFDSSIMNLDTTEVPGIDNLHCPVGAIQKAQQLAAKAFGSDHTFFLINGTTGGIYSMILAATEPGDKIIIPRNCHRSVAGAIVLGRLNPIYINPEVDDKFNIAMGINNLTLECVLLEHPDAKAVVITYPTYYGVCSDIKSIASIVHKHNKLLLVDEAHGAHFSFNDRLPVSSIEAGADIVAQSTHKTLPSMTQSSMLHVKSKRVNLDKLKFFLQLTQTTSPSHIMLATLDAARYIMHEKGKMLLDEIIDWSNWARDEINCIKGLCCLGNEIIGKHSVHDIDNTRLTINVSGLGLSGSEAEEELRSSFKIQLEMSDLYNIVAITTVGDDSETYRKLVSALSKLAAKERYKAHTDKISEKIYQKEFIIEQAMQPWEAVYKEKEAIRLEDSIGRISGEMIVPYPPGIPLILPGEIIKEEHLDYLAECIDKGIKINGPSDTSLVKIAVVCE